MTLAAAADAASGVTPDEEATIAAETASLAREGEAPAAGAASVERDEDRMPDGSLTVSGIEAGDRDSLTSFDLAFLEGPPTYEEGGSLLPSVRPGALAEAELPEEPVWAPSPERRAAALRLFFGIGGGAVLVLVLAALRLLWRAVFS